MIRPSAFAALALLAGCAGTHVAMRGEICGQPLELVMVDRKDRSAFDGHVVCPGGGSVDITTADSSTSRVIEALTANVAALTALVGKLVAAMPAPVAFEPAATPGDVIWAAMQTEDGRRKLGLGQ